MSSERYSVINLREYLSVASCKLSDAELEKLLIDFSCPLNIDTERFLHNSAIKFTRKNQSVTYLVFDTEHDSAFVGYFSLTVKPITVARATLSKTQSRRIERIASFDPCTQTYTAAAYLIAQLAKNYAIPPEQRIAGSDLLSLAQQTILHIQHFLGGVLEFLECENNEKLLAFYENYGFTVFGSRTTVNTASPEMGHVLQQLFMFI